MAIDNLASNESRLSGAYIRSLVKQLSTSKPLNTKNNENLINDSLIVGEFTPQPSISSTQKGDKLGMAKPNNHQQQQQGHKKQVRRRLHTSRPYQERLLNMAEARKEIVTALKYHRASMKQASDRKKTRDEQHIDGHQQLHHQHQSIFGVQDYHQTRTLVKNEPSSPLDNFHYIPSHSNNNNNCNNNYYNNYNNSPSYLWGISSTQLIDPKPRYDTLINNIPLPNQTLGLNLNLQAFTNLDTPFCHTINTTNTTYTNNHYSPLSPSSSSSSTPRDLGTTTTTEGAGLVPKGMNCGSDLVGVDMHPALDEVDMAAIRSVGEQHQIEWDDTLNLVKSARWVKYLKTVEIKREEDNYNYNKNNDHLPFGELEFPPWLSPNNDESFLQQNLDDSCSEDNTTLPWMDIGDIDGMDDEWLS